MPFPSDEHIMQTAGDLVAQAQAIFGKHPGMRPLHAKGVLLTGTFTPSPTASKLSTAPHFNAASTPTTVRFSNSTGIPNIPDFDPNADPRGIGIRFLYGPRKHTDIVAHSTPHFPMSTGAGFLEMLQAIAASPPDAPHPNAIEHFVGANPSALAFVTAPKPPPKSYATEEYWAVTAYKLIDAAGKETFVRYHVVPELGVSTYSAEEVASQDPNYLSIEIKERVAKAPFRYKILAQVASEGDQTDDATVLWPEERSVVELGTLEVDKAVPDEEQAEKQKYIIFDPIPRVEGVGPSEDPLLELRAAVYLIGGKQRRSE